MLSIYTNSHPRATSLQKMVFIIIWKVAGEFVRPKNIVHVYCLATCRQQLPPQCWGVVGRQPLLHTIGKGLGAVLFVGRAWLGGQVVAEDAWVPCLPCLARQ